MYKHFFKRLFDFFLSLIALIVLSPFLIIVTIWLHFANHGAGAFFFQERPGKNAKIFKVIKYKTMTDERDEEGKLLPDEQRLTEIGKFVRSTSIDELPQLINVLKGDMALIGPRPLLVSYLPLYNKEQKRRHDVRPGITGWAQVNGRNHAKLSQKFTNDVWYADHCSLWLDIKIIILTIKNVITSEDIGFGAADMGDVDDLHFLQKMFKFGSDYPLIDTYKTGVSFPHVMRNAVYYACGRQAMMSVIQDNGWKRIWMPSYFCYDIIDSLRSLNIEIKFYPDYPLANDTLAISEIPFEEGDVLFRMNFFGIRGYRDNSNIPIPVIEDHSHDLTGDWAKNSNADWCIASLRKSLPISEGGALWSPKGLLLPEQPQNTEQNELLSEKRYQAMKLKKDFLDGNISDYRSFRSLYIATENEFGSLPLSNISDDSWSILSDLDIDDWYSRKQKNWNYLSSIENNHVKVIKRENDNCNSFSLILLFEDMDIRNRVRNLLICRQTVFPAILWDIPNNFDLKSWDFGNRMLSIHCDARYDNDLVELKGRLVTAIDLALNND